MIGFVILHYQAIDETINCIKAIQHNVLEEKKIIIIDNASPNSSGKELEKKFLLDNEVIVYLMKENAGFAKGNNIGYKYAKQYNPDYIVVMNNDVLITQDNFSKLLDEFQKKNSFDILGPDILSTRTGIHQNPQRNFNYTLVELEKQMKKLRFKNKYTFLLKIKYIFCKAPKNVGTQVTDYKKVQYNIPLHGACYIYSKIYIENHNNCFYNNTFMYYESYILHYLGMREKLKFIYWPEIKVLHHEDVATDQTYTKLYNKALFINKCMEDSCRCFIDIMNNKNARIG